MSFTTSEVEKMYRYHFEDELSYCAKASGHTKRPRPSVLIDIERTAAQQAEEQTRKRPDVTVEEWRKFRGTVTTPSGIAARPVHKQPTDDGSPPRRFGREKHNEEWRLRADQFSSDAQQERWDAWLAGPGGVDEQAS
jgi:hypothetical protein